VPVAGVNGYPRALRGATDLYTGPHCGNPYDDRESKPSSFRNDAQCKRINSAKMGVARCQQATQRNFCEVIANG
jgi:hypothetical protein